MRRSPLALTVLVTVVSLEGSVRATTPVVTVTAKGARIQIQAATVAECIDALSRAAGFKVTYEGARPMTMLFNAEIDTPSVAQTLNRLLEGQNLNYGVVFDLSGAQVTTLALYGAPQKTSGSPGSGVAGNRPQGFAPPRRTAPVDEPPVEEPPQEPTPEPIPSPTPATPPAASQVQPSPFGPRPFGRPLGVPLATPPPPKPTPSA